MAVITNVDERMFQYLLLRSGIGGSTSLFSKTTFRDLNRDGHLNTETELFLPCVDSSDRFSTCRNGLRHLTEKEHAQLMKDLKAVPMYHSNLLHWRGIADAVFALRTGSCHFDGGAPESCDLSDLYRAISLLAEESIQGLNPNVDARILKQVLAEIREGVVRNPLPVLALAYHYMNLKDFDTAEGLLKMTDRKKTLNPTDSKDSDRKFEVDVCMNCADLRMAAYVRLHDLKGDLLVENEKGTMDGWWAALSPDGKKLAIKGLVVSAKFEKLPDTLKKDLDFLLLIETEYVRIGDKASQLAVLLEILKLLPGEQRARERRDRLQEEIKGGEESHPPRVAAPKKPTRLEPADQKQRARRRTFEIGW